MISGIGVDIVQVARIDVLYNKYPKKMLHRLLSSEEIEIFATKKNKIHYLAKRFAAKEAVAKALGTGFHTNFYLSDISILNDTNGKPIVKIPKLSMQKQNINLSISDEKDYVVAFCVIES